MTTTQTSHKKVIIYTDGACSGNPGPGGWGAVLIFGDTEKEVAGYEADTTNNRMELMAMIMALRTLKEKCEVVIHTDSKYALEGLTKWLPGWKAKGWKTAGKTPVKNIDLWQALEQEVSAHNAKLVWVKGHNGDKYNDKADFLARQAIKSAG